MGWLEGLAAFNPVGLIGTAASMGGEIYNAEAQKDINKDNINLAERQMQFQERMSNTSHQREVADMIAAGINPIYGSNSGSSTPSGAAPNLQAPQIHMPDMMAYGVSLRQLEQTDQRLAIDAQNSASMIAKNLTDQDLTKMKTVMAQKGMIRADLEGDAAKMMRKVINKLKTEFNKPRPTPQGENSMGQPINLMP